MTRSIGHAQQVTEFDDVLQLIAEDDRTRGDRSAGDRLPEVGWAPTGATDADLNRLRDDLGFEPPPVLVRWLSVCNGHLAGQGGLLGTNPPGPRAHLNIAGCLQPGWRERRWIPIAGDGCGDTYVLDASRTHFAGDAIFFVDQSDLDALDYVVASDLPIFLRQLLRDHLNQASRWPFDQETTLAADPRLAEVRDRRLLPWNA